MNKELLGRLELAGQYQKKAIRALFPEGMEEHIEVIENELKAMFMEVVVETMKYHNAKTRWKNTENKEENETCDKVKNSEKQGRTKKVHIV